MFRNEKIWITVALAVAATLIGCSKKSPATPAEQAMDTPAAESPAPAPSRPATSTDPWDGDLASINEMAFRQGLLGHVYFAYDEASLQREAEDRLEKNVRFLTEHPQFVVLVEGHCDERGTNEYNLALGDRRAGVTRQYLAAHGIDPSRVQVISYGKERPSCMESAEGCWSRNRRANFSIVGRVDAG